MSKSSQLHNAFARRKVTSERVAKDLFDNHVALGQSVVGGQTIAATQTNPMTFGISANESLSSSDSDQVDSWDTTSQVLVDSDTDEDVVVTSEGEILIVPRGTPIGSSTPISEIPRELFSHSGQADTFLDQADALTSWRTAPCLRGRRTSCL